MRRLRWRRGLNSSGHDGASQSRKPVVRTNSRGFVGVLLYLLLLVSTACAVGGGVDGSQDVTPEQVVTPGGSGESKTLASGTGRKKAVADGESAGEPFKANQKRTVTLRNEATGAAYAEPFPSQLNDCTCTESTSDAKCTGSTTTLVVWYGKLCKNLNLDPTLPITYVSTGEEVVVQRSGDDEGSEEEGDEETDRWGQWENSMVTLPNFHKCSTFVVSFRGTELGARDEQEQDEMKTGGGASGEAGEGDEDEPEDLTGRKDEGFLAESGSSAGDDGDAGSEHVVEEDDYEEKYHREMHAFLEWKKLPFRWREDRQLSAGEKKKLKAFKSNVKKRYVLQSRPGLPASEEQR
jgi:hypothetical protein